MKKETRNLLIKVCVSAVLFYIIYRQNDSNFSLVISNFSKFNYWYIPLILGFIILNYVLGAFRWKALLIFENTEDITIVELISLYFKGAFFNNFMPTSIGGDVYKVIGLNQKLKNLSHSFASTFMERFTGVIVLFLISLVSFPLTLTKYDFLTDIIGFEVSVWGAIGMSVGLFLLFLIGLRIGFWLLDIFSSKYQKLRKIYNALNEYSGHPRVVITALVTSILVQLVSIFTQYFVFLGLNIHIPLFFALTVFPIIGLISFLPISLNGYGVQDGLYKFTFGFVNVSNEISLAASLFYHMSRLIISLIGGVLYALEKNTRKIEDIK